MNVVTIIFLIFILLSIVFIIKTAMGVIKEDSKTIKYCSTMNILILLMSVFASLILN